MLERAAVEAELEAEYLRMLDSQRDEDGRRGGGNRGEGSSSGKYRGWDGR
jgi:hypothetical protein